MVRGKNTTKALSKTSHFVKATGKVFCAQPQGIHAHTISVGSTNHLQHICILINPIRQENIHILGWSVFWADTSITMTKKIKVHASQKIIRLHCLLEALKTIKQIIGGLPRKQFTIYILKEDR